jgi:hypothetical protein
VYDERFLGVPVSSPVATGAVADDVLDVGGTTRWDYTHF